MAQTAEMIQEEIAVPEGGIGNFVMEDEKIEEFYGSSNMPTDESGIAQFPDIAKKMAEYGRNEDDTLAHVATGELVIPRQFLQDAVIKQRIFDILIESGIEDPESYVVGSEDNSINPTTGLPEFFLKKLLKKVATGVKKVVKGVVKVVKKVAPVVLPIALAMTPLGAVYGAALGSGIGTLINGGSIKDAMKSALVAGATGAVFKGFTGQGTFGQNVSQAVSDPLGRISQAASGFGEGVRSGSFGGFKDAFFKEYVAPSAAPPAAIPSSAEMMSEIQANQAGVPSRTAQDIAQQYADLPALESTPGFGESLKGAFTPGDEIGFGEGLKQAFLPSGPSVNQVLESQGINPFSATTAQRAAAEGFAREMGPSLLRRALPLAVAAGVVGKQTGMFEMPAPEQASFIDYDEEGRPVTGQTLIGRDPSRYLISDLGSQVLDPTTGQYVPSNNMYNPIPIDTSPYVVPTAYPLASGLAKGGSVFPRRTGGIMPNEGIPNKDSVKAMLMPGEFVMTTDAVKGAGNGSLKKGINNMYSVMRNLERRGRAIA